MTAKTDSEKIKKNPGLISRGIFVDRSDKPEYCEQYDKIIQSAQKAIKEKS